MKRRLGGIVLALALVLGSARVASANIVWATLAHQNCTLSSYDLWLYSHDPFWFASYAGFVSQDQDAWLTFRALGGDEHAMYLMFLIAPQYASCFDQ